MPFDSETYYKNKLLEIGFVEEGKDPNKTWKQIFEGLRQEKVKDVITNLIPEDLIEEAVKVAVEEAVKVATEEVFRELSEIRNSLNNRDAEIEGKVLEKYRLERLRMATFVSWYYDLLRKWANKMRNQNQNYAINRLPLYLADDILEYISGEKEEKPKARFSEEE